MFSFYFDYSIIIVFSYCLNQIYKQMNSLTRERIYRSVPLSNEEIRDLKKWIKDENRNLYTDAAVALGVTRTTLRNLMAMKSCSHKTYEKIKAILQPASAA